MATAELETVHVTPEQEADLAAYRAYVEADFTTEDMAAVLRHQRWMAEHSCDSTAGAKFEEQLARVEAYWAAR